MNPPSIAPLRVLSLQGGKKPDYLCDMLWIEMATNPNIELFSNNNPSYLFSDYPDQKKLYGRGFTLYKKLSNKYRSKILSEKKILSYIKENKFDIIIFPSIRRYSSFFEYCFKHFDSKNLVVVDGEDDEFISRECFKSIYFKRQDKASIYCDWFINKAPLFLPKIILKSIREKIKNYSEKTTYLAPAMPQTGSVRNYIFETEESYYAQYAKSWFGYTTKKAGWESLRHYEIIACGTLPYFNSIKNKPNHIMPNYPIEVQLKANDLYHIGCAANELSDNWKEEYFRLSRRMNIWINDLSNFSISKMITIQGKDNKLNNLIVRFLAESSRIGSNFLSKALIKVSQFKTRL